MSMQLKCWLKNIIGDVVAPGMVVLSLSTPAFSAAPDPGQAGSDLGKWVLERLGSTDGIRERSAKPLTNNDTPMKSLDDATSFDAQLSCPSSNRFLKVTAAADGGTGDLFPLTVEVDQDMDDMIDYTYSFPFPVSGVCANGVIACDVGTWSGCNYYKWAADSNTKVSLQSVFMTELEGCYCVNNSCGGPSATTLSRILDDLGGGVAAAIQTLDPKYAISDVKIAGSSINFYGQGSAACSAVPLVSGSVNPEQYFGSPAGLPTDTASEVTSQSGDPDSFYNLMAGSLAAGTAASAYPACAIDRVITVTTTTNTLNNSGSGTICNDHFIYARIYEANPTTFHLQLLDTSPGGFPHWNCGGPGTGGGIGDWHTLEIVTLPAPPTSFSFSINASGGGCSTTSTSTVSTSNTPLNVITCSAGGAQFPNYTYSYLFNYTKDDLIEVINDTCTGLEADSKCQLKEESVDGVRTYAAYNPTGLSPLASCKNFTGAVGTYTKCRDWWEKDRTYRCETDTTYDFSDAQKRMEVVTGNVINNPTDLYYEDLRKEPEGTWISENNTVGLPPTAPASDCEMSCKTSKPSIDTDASLSGNTSQFRTSTSSTDFFYKSCPIVSGAPTCPLDPGETLVRDCQCQDDFSEAASQMEVLKSAGENMSCDGTTDPSTGLCTGQIKIFEGKGASCRPSGAETTFFNCCSNGSSSIVDFLKYCKTSEKELNDARDQGRTHEIGKRCIKKIPLIGCVQKERVYCSFNGKLGRIVQEQGRPQLKTFGPSGNWGSPGAPNCTGFSPEDFQMIDFGQIDLSDYFGDITTKNQGQMETEMGNEINDFYNDLRP